MTVLPEWVTVTSNWYIIYPVYSCGFIYHGYLQPPWLTHLWIFADHKVYRYSQGCANHNHIYSVLSPPSRIYYQSHTIGKSSDFCSLLPIGMVSPNCRCTQTLLLPYSITKQRYSESNFVSFNQVLVPHTRHASSSTRQKPENAAKVKLACQTWLANMRPKGADPRCSTCRCTSFIHLETMYLPSSTTALPIPIQWQSWVLYQKYESFVVTINGQGELEHHNPKARYKRTSKKQFVWQIAHIEHQQTRIRYIYQKMANASHMTESKHVPVNPEIHHYIGITEKHLQVFGPFLWLYDSDPVLASSLIRVTFTLSLAMPHTTREKTRGSAGSSRLR